MNTLITYLYRDASNYKQLNEAVVEGEMDDGMIEDVMSCLHDFDGEMGWFIPSQIGLDEERPGDFDEQDDHVWFELTRDGFEDTDRACTTWPVMSAQDLVEAFEEATRDGWDETAAWERLAY